MRCYRICRAAICGNAIGVIVLMGKERRRFAQSFRGRFVELRLPCLSSRIEHASISTASVAPGRGAKRQVVSVAGDPRINIALFSEAADEGIHSLRAGAHDRRPAMGEDSMSNMRLCAPVELMDDRVITDQRTSLSPHHAATMHAGRSPKRHSGKVRRALDPGNKIGTPEFMTTRR